jgi:jouberin
MLQNETKTPFWNQKIVLNEKYFHIVDPNVIIFFEILDFVNNLKALRRYPDGWNRIAWAFLKPIGSDGKPTTNHEVILEEFNLNTLSLTSLCE